MRDDEDYPDGWALAALRFMEHIDYRCQGCDKQCRRPCEPVVAGTTMRVLPRDGQRTNQAPANLIALCPVCRTPAALRKRLQREEVA